MFYQGIKSLMSSRFAREEKGSASIEAVIMVPAMFLCILTFVTLIDYTRLHGMHQKAAYTISDMVSRETLPIDADYLAGTKALLDTLTRNPQTSTVRLSIVRYDAERDIFKLDWSKTEGYATPVSNQDVSGWTDRLPASMVHNERMIVVETSALYKPPFDVGLGNKQIENFIFTRPRYAPQVLWQDLEPDFAGS